MNKLLNIAAIGIFILFYNSLHGQTFQVSGYISDAATGERLVGATVYDTLSHIGCSSNEYGYFSLRVSAQSILLSRYVGYHSKHTSLKIHSDTLVHLALGAGIIINEVMVNSSVSPPQIGVVQLMPEMIKKMPAFLGQPDVIKSLQYMSGVQQNKEGTTGFSVRGGSHDQNLFLIDGVPVYNINHFFGFFSVFTPEAVQSCTFYKSGIPAQYGGRLSSVTDIRLKEGNNQTVKGNASIGLIASSVSVEGPFAKKRASFYISARRTYFDLFTKAYSKLSKQNIQEYYFQDYTLKSNYTINAKNRIYLSAYGGNDLFSQKARFTSDMYIQDFKFRLGWGNLITAIRWNSEISPSVFTNLTLYYSFFRYSTHTMYHESAIANPDLKSETQSGYFSSVHDKGLKYEADIYRFRKQHFKLGADIVLHQFAPGINRFSSAISSKDSLTHKKILGQTIPLTEYSFYASDKIEITPRLNAQTGLRFSMYLTQNNTLIKTLQPRLNLTYNLVNNLSLSMRYDVFYQGVHLVSNSSIGPASDLWLPVTVAAPPEKSTQYSIGIAWNVIQSITLSVDAFYKSFDNLTEIQPDAVISYQAFDLSNYLVTGIGYARGMELQAQKNTGKLTGILSYTLSKSERRFDEINDGKSFPFKYDSRHNASVVMVYEIKENHTASASWIFNTGYYVNLSLEKYTLFYQQEALMTYHNVYKNNFSTPSYHHLDISYAASKQKKHGLRTWTISVYNAYGRVNPFMVYWDTSDSQRRGLYMSGLFPIIPSVSYSFSF